MMLLPSISRRSRATVTRASKRVARWTNFAAARACMPSWLTTVTCCDVIGRRPYPGPARPHRGRHASSSPRAAGRTRPRSRCGHDRASPWRRRADPTTPQARQLDQHRQVDAGDHLESIGLEKRHAEVRRRAAEHVGEQQHALPRRAPARSPARCPPARRSTSSCQPIDTAVNCGRSPTIISAAFTSSVASCPCVTTTTPITAAYRRLDRQAVADHAFTRSRCRTRTRAAPMSAERLAQPLGDHHRAVPAAGAADRNRQVALAFGDVVRQHEAQIVFEPVHELARRRVALHEIARPRLSRPVGGRSVGTKCGFGRQRTSNIRSASTGTPCLKPKLSSVTTSCEPGAVARQAHEELPQLVDRHVRRVDDRRRPSRGSAFSRCRSSRIPSVADRSGASGCGRRVSLKRRTSARGSPRGRSASGSAAASCAAA